MGENTAPLTLSVPEAGKRLLPLPVAAWHKTVGMKRAVKGVVKGDELLRTFQPDEGSAKTFCTRCGSNLFGGGWPESEHASVRLSTLDTPVEGKPSMHLYVSSVASWETLPDDGAERFETTSG